MATIQFAGIDQSKLGFTGGRFKVSDVKKSQKALEFATFTYGNRDFEGQFTGTVKRPTTTDTFENSEGQEISKTSLKVRPDLGSCNSLYALETIMEEGSPHADRLAQQLGYDDHADFKEAFPEFEAHILDDHEIQLNQKTNKKDDTKWSFNTNKKEYTPANPEVMELNDELVISVKPGLYLNKEKGKYGWFLTSKQVDWKEDKTATNGKRKK